MSDRVWLTTHMMTSPQSQVAAVSAYVFPGRTGMIHYTVKSSLYHTWPNLLDIQKVANPQLTLLIHMYFKKSIVDNERLLYPGAKTDLERLTARQAKESNSYTFKKTH